MKLKRLGAMLLSLCMLLACMPQLPVGAETAGWINIEAESGDYPSVYNEKSNSNTSGGKYIEVSGSNFSSETDATVDWSFKVDKAGKYDVWVLMTKFAGATSVSQPAWGIDAAASTANTGTEASGAVYNFAYASGFGGYTQDFVWVKLEVGHDFTAGNHTIQYIPQLSTLFTERLLAGLDVIRVVPSSWNWAPDASLDAPTVREWFDVQAEDGTGFTKGTVTNNAAASGGKYVGYNLQRTTAGEPDTITMTFEAPVTDNYDMWIVAGDSVTNSVAQITISLDGNTYTQPEILPDNNTLYTHWTDVGWSQPMFWQKTGSSIALEAGKTYTMMATIPASSSSSGGWLHALDVVRFVPTAWHWKAGADVSEPTRPAWLDLEAEEGTLVYSSATGTDSTTGRKYMKASQYGGGSGGNTSTMSFSVNKGVYDIWAVVGGNASGQHAGSYTFTIDGGTDNELVSPQINMENVMTMGGDTLYVGDEVAGGFDMNMKWVKVASAQELSEGKHTMLAAVTEASKKNGNMLGAIDVVRIVPAEWHWTADNTFSAPTKSTAVYDGSFAWIEGEDLINANDDASVATRGTEKVTNPSGGLSLYAFDNTKTPKFTYTFYVDNAGDYEVWNYGYMYGGGTHFGYITAECNGTSTTGAANYEVKVSGDGGFDSSDGNANRWDRLTNNITLKKGWNTITLTCSAGSLGNNLFNIDALAIVPASWGWRPSAVNALNTAPVLDALSAQKSLTSKVGNEVTKDLSLINYGAAGSTITYTSTNSAISNTGAVTVPTGWYGGDSRGTITATATKGTLNATSSAVATVVNAVRPIEYTGMTFDGDFTAKSTVTAKFTGVKATADEDGLTANGIIAVYNKDGDIVSVGLSGEKAITTTAQDIKAETTLPEDMTGVKVKGFLWTGFDTIIPISDTLAYGADSAGYDDDLLPALKAKYDAKGISDGFNIGIITDVQTPSLSGYGTYNHHYQSIVNASKLIKLDAIADLGDMIMGSSADKTNTIKLLEQQSTILKGANLPIFRIKGNHDDNRWAVCTNSNASLFITDEEWTDACDVDWATTMEGSTKGSKQYYYKDFAEDKIRVIALDTQNIPYTWDGSSNVSFNFGFNQEQLNWLATEALDFSDKSDKAEWGVVLLMHALAYDAGNTVINFSGFGDIMTAFMNGTSGEYSNDDTLAPVTKVAYDFTAQGKMEVICIFNGHTHTDGDGKMWGMKFITTGSSLPDSSDAIPDRDLYTKNEDLWDIMTIDRTNRKIYATRFGAGADREFSY